MQISKVRIHNFRSIKNLEMDLGPTTVLIGPNNTGKTAILDAVRNVLTRRWGQRGTGFTENDVHRADEQGDPKALPPVRIEIMFEEPSAGDWDADMVAALEDIAALTPDGRNILTVRVTCGWSADQEAFDPVWEFLDAAGQPLTGKAQRATNLTGFFGYVPLFWLGALRDALDEFTPRSGHWGRLLRSVNVPKEVEEEVLRILAELDAKIAAADPKLAEIAELIGHATRVAVGEGPGSARLNTLPLSIEEMLQRTGIVLRHEALRPWLPLSQHGQGLQSLAVVFLFQAAALQQLIENDRPGAEAIFAIEEPEAHLHPQASRTLWERVQALSGQKLMTTHSPYFVQHVPLRDLRLLRLRDGCTEYSSIPQAIGSDLPWTAEVDNLAKGAKAAKVFFKAAANRVAVRSWFAEDMADALRRCYRDDPDAGAKAAAISELRYRCRVLPSVEDETDLGFQGRRIRGEIFFARRWILVEGVCEYLLLHALGRVLGWDIDTHGVSVIDFQQCGNAGIYPTLAEGFGVPWHMIMDGDTQSTKFKSQIIGRGFSDADLAVHVATLTAPNNLEDQLLADGHEALLREILAEAGIQNAKTCPAEEFRAQLGKRKTTYMSALAARVASDAMLAMRMPKPFVELVISLRDGGA
ncbi:MAG: ATP-dependent nuclease [Steroidobacteraceae bacterium]